MSCCKVQRYATLVAALILLCMLTLGESIAADVPGSGDHPLVGRFEGAEIVGYSVKEYDETQIIEQWLKQKRGTKVEILSPERGEKRE